MRYACLGYYNEKSFEALQAAGTAMTHPGLAFGFFEIRPLDEAITARARTRA